ncbi:RNP domain protein [Aspergillus fijiensis CBS 313.89]|uniref:RNA-binding domain-containing protein n=1 Tax=Aspergillus fijiensis CBS 313.89 TaxID=1448319 RepID=A0A8G1RKY4_9EURO|nr:RNA-binding domain-containing protein [Aspergillus fijiensis CBS 313.89]RAK73331.1 RNA-binding domain-containing protein [Aspergillus fijiensis CBS 313.89]
MSFPPPPGLRQAPSSLPARPPPPASTASPATYQQPAYSAAPSYAPPGASSGYGSHGPSRPGYGAATAFAPRSVASTQPYRTSSPVVSAPPTSTSGYATPTTTGYGNYYPPQQQPQASYQSAPTYYGAPAQYNDGTSYGPSVPRIQNPFQPAAGRGYGGRNDSGMDPETEAQIAQWQSAYANKEELPAPGKVPGRRDANQGIGAGPASGANTPSGAATGANTPAPIVGVPEPAPKTVVRSGGGQNWTDSTLLEWDPAHFRLFVGNLAGEVTDDSLLKAFAKYTSVQKARVIRDKRTQKSKGYGFVSFSDGDDYFKAAREMQGKYIGSHPVLLRRATTEVRPVSNNKNGKKHGGGGGSGGGSAGGGKVKHDGVKKHGKTKGGLKILG